VLPQGLLTLAAALGLALAQAQAQDASARDGWAACSRVAEATARLACFDRWAAAQAAPAPTPMAGPAPEAPTGSQHSSAAAGDGPPVVPTRAGAGPHPVATAAAGSTAHTERPCSQLRHSHLVRYWELEPASDCGTFTMRGYRPLSVSWIGSDGVNAAPQSPSPGRSVARPVAYSSAEMRLQLSVRTKIARGLLTEGRSDRRDSLWFGYTQQSYWQLFNGSISRPFRSTDHEPELIYIHPLDLSPGSGWRLRYGGMALNHQSNGQSLPLSRSWNRINLMAGMENGKGLTLTGRLWARLPERAGQDDNPDISDYIGRAELGALWNINQTHTLGVTLRHTLRSSARGSVRIDWLRALGEPRANGEPSNLRLHTQLFSGYGDSLLDYNRRRTVLSIGLSLIDF